MACRNFKDTGLRSHKFQILSERQYYTGAGGQLTADSLDVFNNQQILKSAKQGIDHVDMHDIRGICRQQSGYFDRQITGHSCM